MRRLLAAPFHAIFTHFTIALTATSLAFDALGWLLDDASLATGGWWTIAAAVLMTPGTLASGLTARRRLPMEEGLARRWLRAHMAIGPIFFGGLIAAAFWRASLWSDDAPIPWTYLVALGALALLMTVQGYLGGELVYRFGAEVRGAYPRLPTMSLPRHDDSAAQD